MNTIYDAARVKLLSATLNWVASDLMLSAWSGTPSFIASEYQLADIIARGYTERGSSMIVNNKGVSSDGTAQTDHILIPTVSIGPDITWFTMSVRKPTHNLSDLILYIDDAVELPFTPNGLDMVVSPDWLNNRGWFRP